MRGRVGRDVARAVDGDAVVEVPRVLHPAQGADAVAVVRAGEPEHATGRLRLGADLLGDQLGVRVAVLVGVVGGGLAERGRLAVGVELARGDVRDEDRLVVAVHRHHLQRQVDLDVRAGTGAARQEPDVRVRHLLPDVVGDHRLVVTVGEVLPGDVADQLLERPDRLLGARAELAVGGARLEAEFGQTFLDATDVVAERAQRDRRSERGCRRRSGGLGRGRDDAGGCTGHGGGGRVDG